VKNEFMISVLTEVIAWWTARMIELAPASLKPRAAGVANALIIAASDTPAAPVTVLHRRNGSETPLGMFTPDRIDRNALRAWMHGKRRRRAILLRPPRGALLETHLHLPLAAAPDLRSVIGYEINRTTPFEPHQIYWTWTVEARDRTVGRIRVRLSLVPKAPLLPLLAALAQVGLSPSALEAVSSDDRRCMIPLRKDEASASWKHRTANTLAAACGVCAIVAVLLPFSQQWIVLDRVENRIATLQPQVMQVQAIRQRIAAERVGRDGIAQERAKLGNTLKVLSVVTDLLPDDTFLQELSLHQRQLTVSGRSSAAARLIATMASNPTFLDPGFSAPVRHNEVARADEFSIRSGIAP
jgi:general secretion pathway protein L